MIKQENRTYRSTPFQVVFSSNLIKQIEKNRAKHKNPPYKLSLTVNDKPVDVNIKIDQSGRIVFEKVDEHLFRFTIEKCHLWFPTLPMSLTKIIRINLPIRLSILKYLSRGASSSNTKTNKPRRINFGSSLGFSVIKRKRVLLPTCTKLKKTRATISLIWPK